MILSFIEHRVFHTPNGQKLSFFHKPYTLCVLCVLRGEFLQCTHYSTDVLFCQGKPKQKIGKD